MIIADKAGDVHRCAVSPDTQLPESDAVSNFVLLGHVSMLLDMVGTFLLCLAEECPPLGCYVFLGL